jgi:DNA-binding Lrp family transcriptional regulator
MAKRKNPQTSRDAHESIKPAKGYYHKKIIEALERIRVGATYEEAAKVAGIRPDQAWRRMSELVQAGIVYNVGITRQTSSGRKAMVRQLVGMKAVDTNKAPKTQAQQKAKEIVKQLQLL